VSASADVEEPAASVVPSAEELELESEDEVAAESDFVVVSDDAAVVVAAVVAALVAAVVADATALKASVGTEEETMVTVTSTVKAFFRPS
jgi:hypothetical protein